MNLFCIFGLPLPAPKMAIALVGALYLFFLPQSNAQAKFKAIRIPFTYENNFIVVQVTVNDRLPLRFLFDTGAEHSLLLSPQLANLLDLRASRTVKLLGSDMKTELLAWLCPRVKMIVGNGSFPYQSLLVLQENHLQFAEFTGIRVDGVLGADFFRWFVLRINFEGQYLELIPHEHFKPPARKFHRMPIRIKKYRPYLQPQLFLSGDSAKQVNLLFDTGASLGALFHAGPLTGLTLPQGVQPGNIGMGLGGELEGFLGRVDSLVLGKTTYKNIVAHFQDVAHLSDSLFSIDRQGILGNQMLSRYEWYLDYLQERCFYKPIRHWKQPFRFDRSGLTLLSTGAIDGQIVVHHIVPLSAAQNAGVLPGDIIQKINGRNATRLGIQGIFKLLSAKPNKRIRLKILRNGTKISIDFSLPTFDGA